MKFVEQSAELLALTPNPLELIAEAGRTCYKSDRKGNEEEFVRMLLKNGHESVLEHVSATFRLVTDRGISHELVRHRIASYSQESTRYVNYGMKGEVEMISIPVKACPEVVGDMLSALSAAESAYMKAVAEGVPPELARAVLPTCLKTEIVVTMNLRAWRHAMKLRLAGTTGKPHPQIRELFECIWCELMWTEVAVVFEEFDNDDD